MLVKHFELLQIKDSARVFVPLCGKTIDIKWLLSQGYSVVGVELSPIAIQELFEELELQPQITPKGSLIHYQAPQLDLFEGDLFDLSPDLIGSVDAIYDRAALVALPLEMRIRYTQHLNYISRTAPQLLICFEYDQTLRQGPPFSITSQEVHTHYQEMYDLNLLDQSPLPNGLKGEIPADLYVWQLKPRAKS